MTDLSAKDIERAKFTFGIYDMDGVGAIDSYLLGDMLRALGLNPTLKLISKLGGTTKRGEKMFKIEEFLPLFADAKKDKDVGNMDDFIECLKLYDKDLNGKMSQAQLNHVLQAYGEKLDSYEAERVIREACDPADEDGYINWMPFLKRITAPLDEIDVRPEAAATIRVSKPKPSITVAAEEPEASLSFAAAKPMVTATPEPEEEEAPQATFTLKKPKKSVDQSAAATV